MFVSVLLCFVVVFWSLVCSGCLSDGVLGGLSMSCDVGVLLVCGRFGLI